MWGKKKIIQGQIILPLYAAWQKSLKKYFAEANAKS